MAADSIYEAQAKSYLRLLLNLLSKFDDSWAGVANVAHSDIDFVPTDDAGRGFVQTNVVTPEGREFRIEIEYVGEAVREEAM